MNWIAIHEEVLGSKLRGFRKRLDCSEAEGLGILAVLWLWARKNADISGLIGNADRSDIARAIQPSLSKSLDSDEVTECLIEEGWIDDIDGQLYIHDWYEWQQYWFNYLEKKEKDKLRKRAEREKSKAEEGKQKNEEKKKESASDTEKKQKYSTGFEVFWKEYPRAVDKGNAYKKYCARLKDGFSDEQLIEAAKAYADECSRLHTEQKYIKHPKTFLSDAMPFIDYLTKEKTDAGEEQTDENPFSEYV